jgi:hypothetical protein
MNCREIRIYFTKSRFSLNGGLYVYMELLSGHKKIITKSGISLNAGTLNRGFTVIHSAKRKSNCILQTSQPFTHAYIIVVNTENVCKCPHLLDVLLPNHSQISPTLDPTSNSHSVQMVHDNKQQSAPPVYLAVSPPGCQTVTWTFCTMLLHSTFDGTK